MNVAVNDRISRSIYGPLTEADLPDPPTHCICGRILRRYYERDGYTEWGEEVQTLTVRCPRTIGWWNRLLLLHMLHDEYEPDHFTKPYWRKREYR